MSRLNRAGHVLLGSALAGLMWLPGGPGPAWAQGATVGEEEGPPAVPDAVARLQTEGIRAMSRTDPEELAAAGLNLALPWERPLAGARKTTAPDSPTILTAGDFSEEAIETLRGWARGCRDNHIVLMYMMNVAAEPSVRYLTGLEPEPGGHLLNYIGFGDRDPLNPHVRKIWPAHHYRHVVDWNGEAARWAPCPLERRYWLGFIRPQLELVARVLAETGASGGAALELETYCFYSIYPGMASQKKAFCYCDECFYGFVRSLGGPEPPGAVLPAVRFDWLNQRGLLPAYERYLEDQLAEIIGEVMQEVRRIDPDFLFGMYPYAPFWYYDGLIRGAGTPELPCLLFPSAEYYTGYLADPPRTYFGDASTPAGLAHLQRRGLHALYAGGLYDRGINSPEAYALAADRLLRDAGGFWAYRTLPGAAFEPYRDALTAVNRWNREHPGPLPAGSVRRDALAAAAAAIGDAGQDGVAVEGGRIVARCEEDAREIPLVGGDFDDADEVAHAWQGRGALPPLDEAVVHSGRASLRFEPSAAGDGPISPYIDRRVPEARDLQCELSFRVRTDAPEPARLWVGTATSEQYPAYMWYHNFTLPARQDWTRLRIVPVSFEVLRFWCPPTDGRLWLDDVRLRPVQERVIDVPLELPDDAVGWGTVKWRLSPVDARADAELLAADDDRVLCRRLYSGDSLAPLAAVAGRGPVRLRLHVYPSAAEAVVLEEVTVGYVEDEQ